jgi:hypothetical protein
MPHALKNSAISQEPKLVDNVEMDSDQPEKTPPTLLIVLLVPKETVPHALLMNVLNVMPDFS